MSGREGGPLAGVRVVEVALGVTVVGAGMAASVPGMLLRDFGADVARVQSAGRGSLDAGVEHQRVWDRGKHVVEVADDEPWTGTVAAHVREADVVLVSGPERLVEQRGLTARGLGDLAPGLVQVRIRPSFNALGPMPDIELLVAARAGLLTQIRARRPVPVFADLAVANAGAALAATTAALAGLYQRQWSGTGQWAETSLYDGLTAILPMITGRVEHPSAATNLLWTQQGPAAGFFYRCADGEYVQLWIGAKGAYEAFLSHIGDPPSEAGYSAETVNGTLDERSRRWEALFATRSRAWWLEDLAGHEFRCEPVWRPGEALRDDHVAHVGLCEQHHDPERGPLTMLGPVGTVREVGSGHQPAELTGPMLRGVRVLDLSAYLAGPVTTQVLAELGADVLKVEPITGDAHRSMEPMYAAGQRAKRALALDLKLPGAAAVLERLVRWSTVVHHNARVGLAERLGYDEATVRAVNPSAVYCHASGFGPDGPKALLAANDHLMQALTGVEAAQGGFGEPPNYLGWGAVDVTSGWVAACAVLAALYAKRRSGAGQSVSTSLLGAGMMLKSGAFWAGGELVGGPVVDTVQCGYGATYRIYRAGDGAWFAMAIPDATTWRSMLAVAGDERLPVDPPPLRTGSGAKQPEELVLEELFATRSAVAWVGELRAAGVPVEPVADTDRAGYAAGLFDDPVNRQLGRVVSFEWGARGGTEQASFPVRFGPEQLVPPEPSIASLGQHTHEVLHAIGFTDAERAALVADRVVPG